jgi:hypothetical protein
MVRQVFADYEASRSCQNVTESDLIFHGMVVLSTISWQVHKSGSALGFEECVYASFTHNIGNNGQGLLQ